MSITTASRANQKSQPASTPARLDFRASPAVLYGNSTPDSRSSVVLPDSGAPNRTTHGKAYRASSPLRPRAILDSRTTRNATSMFPCNASRAARSWGVAPSTGAAARAALARERAEDIDSRISRTSQTSSQTISSTAAKIRRMASSFLAASGLT